MLGWQNFGFRYRPPLPGVYSANAVENSAITDLVDAITSSGTLTLAAVIAAAMAGNAATGTGGITTATGVAHRAGGVAPCGIYFDASSTTNTLGADNITEILYVHFFGDGSAGVWSHGTTAGFGSKNVARGVVAAHVYEQPGVYTHILTAIYRSSGNVVSVGASTSTTITVTNPDTIFAGANTLCFANGTASSPGDPGVPTGATCVGGITTVPAAMTQAGINSGSGTANKRLLFRRGGTYTVPSADYIRKSGGIIGAYGTGADPIIQFTSNNPAFMMLNGIGEWTFMDLNFQGSGGFRAVGVTTQFSAGANILMLRLEASNTAGMEPSGDGIFMVDCNLHELVGGNGFVGFYSQIGSRVAALGNRIYDCSGIEHNIRFQGCTKIVISNNTLYKAANTKHLITVRGRSMQALGGSIATWSGVWCEHVVVSDNDLDAGPTTGTGWATHFGAQNAGADERTRYVIFERNYVHGNTSVHVMTEALEHVVIRNNLFREEFSGTYSDAVILVRGRSSVGMPSPSGTEILNNTIYQTNGAHASFEAVALDTENGAALATGTVAKNNLVYAPGATSNDYNSGVSGPIFIECRPNGGTSWVASSNSSDSQIKNTAPGFTVPPVTLANWKPTSGYAVGGGVYASGVMDDFNGAARNDILDMGAVNS